MFSHRLDPILVLEFIQREGKTFEWILPPSHQTSFFPFFYQGCSLLGLSPPQPLECSHLTLLVLPGFRFLCCAILDGSFSLLVFVCFVGCGLVFLKQFKS
jgi:hypothetical protein